MTKIILFFPTLLWALGLFEFLLQTLVLGPVERPMGWSVILAGLLLGIGSVGAILNKKSPVKKWVQTCLGEICEAPPLFKATLLCIAALGAVAFWGATYPPFLPQEYDALNYHMGLPRQHLMAGSLDFINWSSGDLFPQPIAWGLAPAWLMTEIPHKLPQFLFIMWGFLLVLNLGQRLWSKGPKWLGPKWIGWIPALAVFGTHGLSIQYGTAMMDLPQLYFLIAAIYAFNRGWARLGALHLAVYTCAKAFSPIQVGLIAFGFWIWVKYFDHSVWNKWRPLVKKAMPVFFISCALLLSRSALVGAQNAGTPLFPFGTCAVFSTPECEGERQKILLENTHRHLSARDQYGTARTPLNFVNHLVKIAIPIQGVNNEYDYPLGLAWLLWLVLLGAQLWEAFKKRSFQFIPPATALAVLSWALWWMGSQQSRWLYPTLILGWLGALTVYSKINKHVLAGALFVSAAFSALSSVRGLMPVLHQSRNEIVRSQIEALRRDPATGLYISKETLYIPTVEKDHAPGDKTWILR